LLQVYFTDTNTNTGYVVGKAFTFMKTINGETNRTVLTSRIKDELDAVCYTDANSG